MAAVVAVATVAVLSELVVFTDGAMDEAALRRFIERLGPLAPAAIVAMVAVAVVFSPIPSGPIAVAAGALYGTVFGGALVLAGAQAGAIAAFALSRHFGYAALKASSSPLVRSITAPRSQAMMMLVVFLSRLVPFISFDAVSYAAGLTSLAGWRFALATLAGVAPASFAFAAIGEGMLEASDSRLVMFLLFGGITLVPVALALAVRAVKAARGRAGSPALPPPQGGK